MHHPLRPRQVVDPHEAVVPLLKADARLAHPSCQILPPVEAHLDAERQPRRQPHVHQPELAVHVIKVQVQALAFLGNEPEAALFVAADAKAHARLHAPQHAHQPLLDAVAAGDLAGPLLLGLAAAVQIFKRPAGRLGHRLGVLLEPLRKSLGKRGKVLVLHARGSQETVQPIAIADRTQRPAEQHSVESAEHANDIILVTLYKFVHGVAPAGRLVLCNTHRTRRSDAFHRFGCGRAKRGRDKFSASLRWITGHFVL